MVPDILAKHRAKWHEDPSGCWLWTGAKNTRGRPCVGEGGRTQLVARLVMRAPAGLQVCHRCDVPACVNPAHLFLGTARDNARDARRKGRHAAGERNGRAILTAEQVDEIRRRYSVGDVSRRELAAEFGVSEFYLGDVIRGVNWGPNPYPTPTQRRRKPGARLTERQRDEIRKIRAATGATLERLGRVYGVDPTTIRKVLQGGL